jgi:hypothetical protein|tara:strand:- start:3416 stop:3838 length:423 start_codon:yes stop_codon:yes gene_type:complete
MGKRNLEVEKEKFYGWMDMLEREPPTIVGICKALGITTTTAQQWKKIKPNYDSREYFESRRKEIDKGIADAVAGVGGRPPNAQMARLLKEMQGEVSKSDLNISLGVLNADDYDNARRKAEQRAEEARNARQFTRIRELPS